MGTDPTAKSTSVSSPAGPDPLAGTTATDTPSDITAGWQPALEGLTKLRRIADYRDGSWMGYPFALAPASGTVCGQSIVYEIGGIISRPRPTGRRARCALPTFSQSRSPVSKRPSTGDVPSPWVAM